MSNAHPDSFAVYDNGVRQHDVNVAVEHTPISIGILLEYGGRYHTLNEIRGQNVPTAAEEWLDQTGPRMTKSQSGSTRMVSSPLPHEPASLIVGNTLWACDAGLFQSSTSMMQSLAHCPKCRPCPDARPLVLMSTGLDTFSRASFADVLAEVRTTGVPIYVINLGPIIRSALPPSASDTGPLCESELESRRAQLQKLARASGGRMYSPESRLDLPCVYDELMATLRVQYVISTNPLPPRTLSGGPGPFGSNGPMRGLEGSGTTVASAKSGRTGLIAEAEYMPAVRPETPNQRVRYDQRGDADEIITVQHGARDASVVLRSENYRSLKLNLIPHLDFNDLTPHPRHRHLFL